MLPRKRRVTQIGTRCVSSLRCGPCDRATFPVCDRPATEPDLTSVRIAVDHLSHAVGVGLTIRRLESSPCNRLAESVEIINEIVCKA